MGFIFLSLRRLFAFSLVCWQRTEKDKLRRLLLLSSKNHRRKQQKHKKVSHFGSRSRVSMALQWPLNDEQPSYVACQPTPLSLSEANERKKVAKVLEHVFLSSGWGQGVGNVRRQEWNSLRIRIQWSWIMKSSVVELHQRRFKLHRALTSRTNLAVNISISFLGVNLIHVRTFVSCYFITRAHISRRASCSDISI